MFAIPGIVALIIFILLRPQEMVPLLQRVPFLHLAAAFAALGWVIDIRLRRTQPLATPGLPWAVGFLGWALVSVAIKVPDQLIQRTLELAVLFALYATIAHGIQRLRVFQLVVGVVAATCVVIALACFYQGLSPLQCVGGADMVDEAVGRPDGRSCEIDSDCFGYGADPELSYRCENVGAFEMHTVGGRVRYRGDLNDPNEAAIVIGAGGVAMLLGFLRRRRDLSARLVGWAAIAICAAAVMMTQSRGGQAALLVVVFVHLVYRYRWLAVVPAIALAIPVLAFGGRGGEDAAESTQLRYEAWATGIGLFRGDPIFGVGSGHFLDHHYLTAHNSFVLVLAEMGLIGLILFTGLLYMSTKSLIVGIRELARVPAAAVAEGWGVALLAALIGMMLSINTLSFSYKPALWLLLALIGGWTSAVRHHRPSFAVTLGLRDVVAIVVGCVLFAIVLMPLFLRWKGEM